MLTITMSAALLVGALEGEWHCGHEKIRDECSACSDESPAVARQIARLQSAGWLGRRKAARALQAYDWRNHPEAAEALAGSLADDDCSLVRQQAAESLAKMRPCLPEVHEAVTRAARSDPSLLTRCWARKAAKAIGKSCVEPCLLCDEGIGLTGDDPLPDESRFGPSRRNLRVAPLPSESMEVPENPSRLSPFTPRSNPPLPDPIPDTEAVPAPRGASTPVPLDGPLLEGSALRSSSLSKRSEPGLRDLKVKSPNLGNRGGRGRSRLPSLGSARSDRSPSLAERLRREP
jgi:hypothetical protein